MHWLVGMFWELVVQLREFQIRSIYYWKAYRISRELGKPLLVVGNPKNRHPCGDVTLDINPSGECPFEVKGDVRDLSMFRYKEFGSAYVAHVLEHLTLDDALTAIDELRHVADYVVILYPTKNSILARLHPDHKIETLEYFWSINPDGVIEIWS